MRFADRDFVQKELELIKLEDQQFEDYATRVIDYMKQHGRNTYPMERVSFILFQKCLLLNSRNVTGLERGDQETRIR